MERQKSIFSFFQKPPPPPHIAADPPVTGTDTPPEKIPRSRLHDRPALPVSSILRKLERGCDSKEYFNGNFDACKGSVENPKAGRFASDPLDVILRNSGRNIDSENKAFPCMDISDEFGPETPLMQPLVPRLKRIKGDEVDTSKENSITQSESTKRMKFLRDSGSMEKELKTPALSMESNGSKFEWLNPSYIRDANRRMPSDPLYDKRTLYIPTDALSKMSATQKQYWEVKRQYMDIVLFFKVGKFYELYELDAEIGQRELDWKMTHSGVGKCRQVGISESGIDDAVRRLVARGYKVGRMEQIETSDQAKSRGASSVIQRKLVQVSCPSTTTNCNLGADAVHLLALKEGCSMDDRSAIYGFALLDYAELKLWAGFLRDDSSYSALGALLVQTSPKEIVYESQGLSKETLKAIKKYSSTGCRSVQLTPTSGTHFVDASEVRTFITSGGYLKDSFNSWISTFSCQAELDLALCALGELVDHLSRLKFDDALRNGDLLPYHVYMSGLKMDGQTLVNLEILNNNVDGGSSGTLYKHLDQCSTASGKRLLRRWICNPLRSVEEINKRLNVVEGLLNNPGIRSVVLDYLRKLPDLERLLGRVKASIGSITLLLLPVIGEKFLKQQVKSFWSLVKGLRMGLELLKLLLKEGSVSLTISLVLNLPDLGEPDEFLNHVEVAMDDAFPNYQEPVVEYADAETLSALIEAFSKKMVQWSQIIYSINCVDVLLAFALTANSSRGSMSRPVFLPIDSIQMRPVQENRASVLKMKGLWHPYAIAENGGLVVPNDIYLGQDLNGCCPPTLLLTGPNMGGKSTLLRATCLAVILAQLGCFVPCDLCAFSPVDIIFTRLGAMDRIMSGESTFFIECAETASILQNATQDSLVLLDELGRGTSTFDGYAIAYAVFRHLVEKVHCRLLFATHYHPLTKEFASHPLVSLQHMACAFRPKTSGVMDREQELFFLYRLTPGACPESYGLQVALMAGIPDSVVEVASRARATMRAMIGNKFQSSELRSEFSSYHEECLKTLLAISEEGNCVDDDYFDTLLCLWHEAKSLFHEDK